MTLSYWMCFGITSAYTMYLWPDEMLPRTVFAAFALWIMGILYLSSLMLGCVLFRQAFSSILFTGGVALLMSLLSIPQSIAVYSPIILSTRNMDLLYGNAYIQDFTIPIIIAAALSVGFIASAVALFEKNNCSGT